MPAEGWTECRLGDLISIQHGWPFRGDEFTEEGNPNPVVINIGNFEYSGGLRLDSTRTRGYRGKYPPEFALSPGDLLLVMTCQTEGGEILGVPARVPKDGKTYLHNQRIGKVVIDDQERADPKFLYWLFVSQQFNRYLAATASGTKILHTSPGRIEDYRFLVPSLAEQRKITQVLDSLQAKIELNHRMNQTLEEICSALFKYWFIDFGPVRAKAEGRWKKGESLPGMPAPMWDQWPSEFEESEIGEIPKGWTIIPLAEAATFTRGVSYRGEDLADSETALVSLKCAGRGGVYREDGLKPYRGKYKEGQVVESGDVVVSHTDVTQRAEVIGRAYRVRTSFRFSRLVASLDMAIVRPNGMGLSREYLAFSLSEDRFRDHAYGYTNGTTVLHLSSQALPDYPLLIPPAVLVRDFSRSVSLQNGLLDEHTIESELLGHLRDTLLPKLLSGEIRVPGGGGT